MTKRVNPSLLTVLENLLDKAIEAQIQVGCPPCDANLFPQDKGVVLQDSTVIKLPAWLYEAFRKPQNQS
jgi:hypothetical protein